MKNKRINKILVTTMALVMLTIPIASTAYAVETTESENIYIEDTEYTADEVRDNVDLYNKLKEEKPEYLKELLNIDYLENEIPKVDLSKDDTLYPDVNSANSLARSATSLGWKIHSKKLVSTNYGPWRNGPSGSGPATIGINKGSIANLSYTNTISGSFPIGSASIGNSLGVTIGKSDTYAASYSISIPKGKRKMIIFRPRYKTYQVVQRYYAKGTFTGKTATATVKVFDNWDFSSKNL
jgi:hypothetical protein